MKRFSIAGILAVVLWSGLQAKADHRCASATQPEISRFQAAIRNCTEAYVGEITSLPQVADRSEQAASEQTLEIVVQRVLKGDKTKGEVLRVIAPPVTGLYGGIVHWFNYRLNSGSCVLLLLSGDGGHRRLYHDLWDAVAPVSCREPAAPESEELPARVERELLNSLEDPNENVATWALVRLGEIGDEDTLVPLKRFLAAGNAVLKRTATFSLIRLGELSVLPQAVDYLVSSTDRANIPGAIRIAHELDAIRRIRDPQAVPQLCRILASKDNSYAKASALGALRAINDESAVPCLRKALDDPAIEIRHGAVVALGLIMSDYSHAPSRQVFQQDEAEYIEYWKAKTIEQK